MVGRGQTKNVQSWRQEQKVGDFMAARKPTVKDWLEIQSDFECMEAMKCVSIGIGKVSADHVFDENQSVKWNREQVNINNARYLQEVARLNTEKNKARDAIYEDIYRAIQAEVGHNLSKKKAMAIWSYAFGKGHAFGFHDIMANLQEVMELAQTLLGGD